MVGWIAGAIRLGSGAVVRVEEGAGQTEREKQKRLPALSKPCPTQPPGTDGAAGGLDGGGIFM